MTLQNNLMAAYRAFEYTKRVMRIGAPNKTEDEGKFPESEWDWSTLGKLTPEQLLGRQRKTWKDEIDPAFYGSNLPQLAMAEMVEVSGMGNCGEQSCVAFKFLARDRSGASAFCIADLVGLNHQFVVIGATGAQVAGKWKKDANPKWPLETVICDPWYGAYYAVKATDGWRHHIPILLRRTQSDYTGNDVPLSIMAEVEYQTNPLAR
jgi:hypothetical protein